MDLHVFPMDTQVCSLLVECYGYTTKDLNLQWHSGNASVDMPSNKELAQFRVIGHQLLNYTLEFSTGSFSDLEIKFTFKRDLLYFILQSYVPSTLIVFCSWVGCFSYKILVFPTFLFAHSFIKWIFPKKYNPSKNHPQMAFTWKNWHIFGIFFSTSSVNLCAFHRPL